MNEENTVQQTGLRVVRGSADAQDVAVLTALLGVGKSADASSDEPVAQRGGWADPAARMRAPLRPGPGAWRAAAR